ncbi:MAG: response regulator [Plesiomonas sp.]
MQPEEGSFSGYRFMLVDDDPVFRQHLIHFLSHYGGTVIEAQNGQYALDKLAHYQPDIILCDLNMPEMGGIELVTILRAHANQTPVIVISGSERFSDVAEALRAGATDYLLKPLDDLYVLHSTINDVLQARKNHALEVEELGEYFQQLQAEPDNALQLIRALMPPAQQVMSHARVRYRQLGSTGQAGLVFDLAAMHPHRFGFYVFDMGAAGRHGPIAALLLRTLFNGFLSQPENINFVLTHQDILRKIYQTFRQAGLTLNPRLLIGSYDSEQQQLQISVAGLSAEIETLQGMHRIYSLYPLGVQSSEQGTLHVETLRLSTPQWNAIVTSQRQGQMVIHVESDRAGTETVDVDRAAGGTHTDGKPPSAAVVNLFAPNIP